MRRRVGRRVLGTAAVGGAAYMVGSHAATKAADQQQEMAQNAQIADLQQQQAAPAQPQPQYAPPPQYATPAPPPQPPVAEAAAPVRDPIEAIKQLGELKAAGVLTDEEFEAKKAELLAQI